jgi:hypothetical protein
MERDKELRSTDLMQLIIEMISQEGKKEKNYIIINTHPTVTVDSASSL